MVRFQKSLLALLRIVLVLCAAVLSRSAPAADAAPAAGAQGTGVGAADTTQGAPSGGKDDSSDDDDDDDDAEEQQ